tara:strand:- start:6934 stop:7836 length:903 start_codon:yes stop_codon:yes gene_type:complete
MSYQNVVRPLMQFLSYFEAPRVLEIGVDKGQTTFPLCHNLSMLERSWLYEGVDIKMNPDVAMTVASMSTIFCPSTEPNIPVPPNVLFYEKNSLEFLKDAVENEIKYNLILIDGDHNYYTVQKELELAQQLALPSTIIICDDYSTKWAYEDLYYAESEGYEENDIATKRQKTEKVGVRPAIHDFIDKTEGQWGVLPGPGVCADYCILYQTENVLDMRFHIPPDITLANLGILEIYFDNNKCPEVDESRMLNLDYVYQRPGPRSPIRQMTEAVDAPELPPLVGDAKQKQKILDEYRENLKNG